MFDYDLLDFDYGLDLNSGLDLDEQRQRLQSLYADLPNVDQQVL